MVMHWTNQYQILKRLKNRYGITPRQLRYIEVIQFCNLNGLYPNGVLIHRILKSGNHKSDLGQIPVLMKLGFVSRFDTGKYQLTDLGIEALKYYQLAIRNNRQKKPDFVEFLQSA